MIVFNYISQLVFNCFYFAINDILADLSSVFERTLFLITLIVVLLDFLLQVFDNYWNLPFKITQFYQIFCDNVPGFPRYPPISLPHVDCDFPSWSDTTNRLERYSPDVILRDGPDILVPLVSVAQILMCMKEFHASEICFYLDVSVNTARKG